MHRGEQVQGRILRAGGGRRNRVKHKKKVKKSKKHGNYQDDSSPHGHDGEFKEGEIIHDAASEFAEMAMAVIGITYALFFVLTALGYFIRSYKQNSYVKTISMMNQIGGFDDPTTLKPERLID